MSVRRFPVVLTFFVAWLAFPVLVVDFQDGWWYACFGRAMVEGRTLRVPVTEWVLQGTFFHRPAWLYALWAHAALSLSPSAWLILEVLLFGGLLVFALWRMGRALEYTPFKIGTVLLLSGWFVMPQQWLRPQVALVPLVASLWLWILEDLGGKRPSAGWVFLISLLASNLHGGVLLLGVFLGIWALLRRDLGRGAKIMAVWALGSSLHPYFPEPWRTNVEFGLHPPAVTEWESLFSRALRESAGVWMIWGIPLILYALLLPALRKKDVRYGYLALVTGVMLLLAWFQASRFVTWAILGLALLLPAGWPSRLFLPRPVLAGLMGSLAVLGLLRFPWVENRVNLEALQRIPPPRALTWGVGRTAHVLCRVWPETPLLNTGLDAIHPTFQDALRAGVRYAVTHDGENAAVLPAFPRMGAQPVARMAPYTLWLLPLDRSPADVHP